MLRPDFPDILREGASQSPCRFPLLLIPLAVYNIIAFLMPSVSFTDVLFKVPMITGETWPVTLADVMLALGIVLLLLEVVKGARPGSKFLMDHLLSLIVFGAAAAEFVMWPKFGNSTYFLLVLLAMADFLGGIAQRTRRRAVAVPGGRRQGARKAEPQGRAAGGRAEPAPAPAPPQRRPRRSVAESVLPDHPEPTPRSPLSRPMRRRRKSRRRGYSRAAAATSPGHAAALIGRRSDCLTQMTCRVRRATLRRSCGCAP